MQDTFLFSRTENYRNLSVKTRFTRARTNSVNSYYVKSTIFVCFEEEGFRCDLAFCVSVIQTDLKILVLKVCNILSFSFVYEYLTFEVMLITNRKNKKC